MTTRLFLPLLVLAAACDESSGTKTNSPPPAGDAGPSFTSGEQLDVQVPDSGRVYVRLASPPSIVTPAADPKADKTWDLAFEGLEVFTNSGPSGGGQSSAFGPLDAIVFLGDTAPEVPFLTADKTGGAFIRWYYYEGAPNHAIHSRFHVFGVREGSRQWKVQVLSYYGERDGAPISALYKIRYQEVLAGGAFGALQTPPEIDGTAGGPQGTADSPSGCIDLGTGAVTPLSPAQARESSVWHLCFHRDSINVNGELGGPRNVAAIDFQAIDLGTETLSQVLSRTPESELARFNAINDQSFAGQALRGDRVVSAFSGLWLEPNVAPPTPRNSAWLVVGADGKRNHLVGFAKLTGATATSAGTVSLSVKAVQ